MTSSLVGSEMCIRDRDDIDIDDETVPPHPWYRDGSPKHERSRSRDAAVSYTHLTLPTICSV
eukprot:11252751-Prorocentrum_lima.AAC.1